MNERLGFVFPGQGPQKVGMGQELYELYPNARQLFHHADTYLKQQWGGPNFLDLCFLGPQELLNNTRFTQPALYVVETATSQVLQDEGIKPEMASGHSLGMFPAYFTARVISFGDGLRLVEERGRAMAEAGEKYPGKMAAVKGSLAEVEGKLTEAKIENVWIANHNSPEQVVLSGAEEAVEKLSMFLKQEKVIHKVLPVSIASHCPLMSDAQTPFALAVGSASIEKPKVALVLDTTGDVEDDPDNIKQEMINQLVSRVLWVDSVRKMIEKGINTFVEVGPGNVLSGLINKIDSGVSTFQVSDQKSLTALLAHLL